MRARLRSVALAMLAMLPAEGLPAQETARSDAPVPFTLSVIGLKGAGRLADAQVRDGGGCKGGDTPPHLVWAAVPTGTKSFALTMYDGTANFWHWALYDLPPDARSFESGQTPSGVRTGRNDYGQPGYGGACPPPGKPHQYRLEVWAMPDAALPVAAGASDREIGAYVKAHALGHADLVLPYGRNAAPR